MMRRGVAGVLGRVPASTFSRTGRPRKIATATILAAPCFEPEPTRDTVFDGLGDRPAPRWWLFGVLNRDDA